MIDPQEHLPDQAESVSFAPAEPLEKDDQSSPSYWQRFNKLRLAIKEDSRDSGIGQKIGLLATAAMIAYEWGPGNEATTPVIAGLVMNHTDRLGGIAATAAITGGFTFVQQTATGATAGWTLSKFPKTANELYKTVSVDEDGTAFRKPWQEQPKAQQFLEAFTLGSSYVVIREAVATNNTDSKHLRKQAVRSAAISGSTVAAAAGIVDSLTLVTEGTPAEHAANIAVDIATSPYLWLGLFGGMAAKNAYQRRHRQQNAPTAIATEI